MDWIQQQLTEVADAVRARRDEIGLQFSRRLREAAPEYYAVDASDLQGAGWAALYVLVDGALEQIASGESASGLPRELADESAAAARAELPWELIARTYHLTHQVLWESVIPEIVRQRMPRDDETLVLRAASDLLFGYFGAATEAARQVYAQARAKSAGHSERRLVERVGQALNGVAVRDVQLGYRLAQSHVAVVAWGGDVKRHLAEVGRSLDAELLVVPAGVGYFWAWFGRPAGWLGVDLVAALCDDSGIRIALGAPALGRTGFASSHRQARLVASLSARKLLPASRIVVPFDEVALMSVVLADESAARVFVEHELAGLAATDNQTLELRRTIVAFSRASHNAKVAARLLGVSERAVRYRVAKLEQMFGADFRAKLPELVVAVEAADALESQVEQRIRQG